MKYQAPYHHPEWSPGGPKIPGLERGLLAPAWCSAPVLAQTAQSPSGGQQGSQRLLWSSETARVPSEVQQRGWEVAGWRSEGDRKRPGEASWRSEEALRRCGQVSRSDGGLRRTDRPWRRRKCEETSEGGQRRQGGDEDEACSEEEDHNALGCHRNRSKARLGRPLGRGRAAGRSSDRSQVDCGRCGPSPSAPVWRGDVWLRAGRWSSVKDFFFSSRLRRRTGLGPDPLSSYCKEGPPPRCWTERHKHKDMKKSTEKPKQSLLGLMTNESVASKWEVVSMSAEI